MTETYAESSTGQILRTRWNSKTGELAISILDFSRKEPLSHIILADDNFEAIGAIAKIINQKRVKRCDWKLKRQGVVRS